MRLHAVLFLCACVWVTSCVASDYSLTLLTNPTPAGAVCLDGTPPGYYFAPASNVSHTNDWVIFIQGGGWCYEEWDCAARANTSIGSSKSWGASITGRGPMSRDPKINPEFYQYNMVIVQYCDGASFSGEVAEPITVGTQTIYFRGRRIMTAVINDLLATKGLNTAQHVLMTGCSAGGLTTFLHADYVRSLLPSSVQRFGAMPGSGYFLLANTVEGKPVYPDEMQYVFHMQNASASLDPGCLAAHSPQDQWQCMFAAVAYRYVKAPSFLLNSAYDSWQAQCIYTSEPVPQNSTANGSCGSVPGWRDCVLKGTTCSVEQSNTLTAYAQMMLTEMSSTPTFHSTGNGAFIHSCFSHCLFYSDAWATVAIDGVTMNEAVSQWWEQINGDYHHMPCIWDPTHPDQCNPTC